MTLLELVQAFCRRTGVTVPLSVVGNVDNDVAQVLALIEEEGNDLATRHQWQALTKEAVFTTIASEDQGDITTIASSNFRYIRNNTIWNRTTELPVIGGLEGQEWQQLKAISTSGIRDQFRIRGNHLLIYPAPTAGDTWAFEYQTRNWILSGITPVEFFVTDNDTFLLSHSLLLQGIRWRWNREKGLDYSELFNTYEIQVKDSMGRDGSRQRLSSVCSQAPRPGVFISNGNWAVP